MREPVRQFAVDLCVPSLGILPAKGQSFEPDPASHDLERLRQLFSGCEQASLVTVMGPKRVHEYQCTRSGAVGHPTRAAALLGADLVCSAGINDHFTWRFGARITGCYDRVRVPPDARKKLQDKAAAARSLHEMLQRPAATHRRPRRHHGTGLA